MLVCERQGQVAFALSRLTYDTVGATPVGVFRSVERPVYDEAVADQIREAKAQRGEGDLAQQLELAGVVRLVAHEAQQ